MSTQTSSSEPSVESEIDRLLQEMPNHSHYSDEYTKLTDQLTKLYKLKELDANLDLKKAEQILKMQEGTANLRLKSADAELKEKDVETHGKLTPEKLAPVLGSLAGIVLILGFERAHVVTSKALGFVMKSR